MEKLVFLGYLVSPDEAIKYDGISIAGNKMQWNVIRCLAEKDMFDIDCVTVAPHASFPRERILFQKKEKGLLLPSVMQTKIAYCNFPLVKQITQIRNVYKTACRLLKKNPTAIVFCFNLFPQIGIAIRRLKRKYPLCKIVCLLADLPIDDKVDRKGVAKLLRKWFDKSTWKSISACERFVVLNENVAKTYFCDKPYIVIEGGVDENEVKPYCTEKKEKKNVLYCGALTEYNGILNLLDSMRYVEDKEITLDIYGGGYLEKIVADYADKNSNIIYHGRVSNKEVMVAQKKAWLLINPRNPDDEIAKLTFPSKTFEYMLSGTPILTTRLNAYSEEYKDKMFFIEDYSAKGIADAIRRLFTISDEEYRLISKKAYDFVVQKKNWQVQTEKMMGFFIENRNNDNSDK